MTADSTKNVNFDISFFNLKFYVIRALIAKCKQLDIDNTDFMILKGIMDKHSTNGIEDVLLTELHSKYAFKSPNRTKGSRIIFIRISTLNINKTILNHAYIHIENYSIFK